MNNKNQGRFSRAQKKASRLLMKILRGLKLSDPNPLRLDLFDKVSTFASLFMHLFTRKRLSSR